MENLIKRSYWIEKIEEFWKERSILESTGRSTAPADARPRLSDGGQM